MDDSEFSGLPESYFASIVSDSSFDPKALESALLFSLKLTGFEQTGVGYSIKVANKSDLIFMLLDYLPVGAIYKVSLKLDLGNTKKLTFCQQICCPYAY